MSERDYSRVLIEVQIDSVRVHLMTPNRLVVLKQINEDRYLPIWVGVYEAEAITVALQEVEVSRPLTHDLIRKMCSTRSRRAYYAHRDRQAARATHIYGAIIARRERRNQVRIDSRSSDAIALSVRAHVPILVNRECDGRGKHRP
jgi:bifunctional DNase/RNase